MMGCDGQDLTGLGLLQCVSLLFPVQSTVSCQDPSDGLWGVAAHWPSLFLFRHWNNFFPLLFTITCLIGLLKTGD